MGTDEEQLNLLALLHFILAGLTALMACIPIIHVVLGIMMVTGQFHGADAPPEVLGWIFIGFGGLFMVMGWTLAALTAVAGFRLKQRRWRVFCMVIAALQCLNMPLGTALGVFSLIVLSRPSVTALFERPSVQTS